MARRRVAQRLREVIEVEVQVRWDPLSARQAQKELRALLAVARAARRVSERHKRQWNGPGAIAREDMDHALSRLDRVSKEGK